jgi:hypothetical protein
VDGRVVINDVVRGDMNIATHHVKQIFTGDFNLLAPEFVI